LQISIKKTRVVHFDFMVTDFRLSIHVYSTESSRLGSV